MGQRSLRGGAEPLALQWGPPVPPISGGGVTGSFPRYVQSLLDIMEFHDRDPEDQATLGQ